VVGTLFTSGQLISTFAPMLHLLAEGMGAQLDEVVQDYDVIYADEDLTSSVATSRRDAAPSVGTKASIYCT